MYIWAQGYSRPCAKSTFAGNSGGRGDRPDRNREHKKKTVRNKQKINKPMKKQINTKQIQSKPLKVYDMFAKEIK